MEKTKKEELASKYADIHMEKFDLTNSTHLPYFHNDRNKIEEAFEAGYEAGEPKWISVEEQTPPFNEHVLIKYIKGKQGEVVTQGYYQDEAQETADRCLENSQTRGKFSTNGTETAEFWRNAGYGLTWFDYSGRQIQNLVAKGSKNKVLSWSKIF